MSSKVFKNGVMYSALGKYSNLVVQFIVNIFLARLLTPVDYGIVAIVQIFLMFFNMLADMGIGPAIIQNKDLSSDDVRIIFKFSIYLAIVLAILFTLLGYPVSVFYSNTVYIPIFIILGVSVFFHALLIVPRSILLKDKKFKTVNSIDVISSLIKGLTSIVLALAGFKYYSIIIGGIIQAVLKFVFYYVKTKVSPNIQLKKESLYKILQFSRNQFIFNFINYFSRNLDGILIGRYLTAGQLGYYNKSYQLSMYPTHILSGVITPVIQPVLSDYETNLKVIKNVYIKITRILSNLGVPLSVFLFFSAENVIFFLFGNQWENSIMSFKILSLSIWVQVIASSTGAFYQSSNRTDLLLLSGIQSMVINIISIIIGINLGTIESVSMMLVISFSINYVINNYLLLTKVFKSKSTEVVKALYKPLLMGALQIIVFLLMPDLNYSYFFNLVIQGIAFLITLLLGLVITRQFKELLSLLIE